MLYVAEVVCKTAKRAVREWYSSTIGPLLPTMTNSLPALGREVLYKRYHGQLFEIVPEFQTHCLRQNIVGPTTYPSYLHRGCTRLQGLQGLPCRLYFECLGKTDYAQPGCSPRGMLIGREESSLAARNP